MSTKAGGGLIAAHQMSTFGGPRQGGAAASGKPRVEDYMAQNEVYEDVLEKINQKLALKDAIDRANKAIASSKQPSRFGGDDTRSQKSHSVSQYSRRTSQAGVSDHGSMRSAAHELVQTLQVQLERERQQKRKLAEHLERIEASDRESAA